MTPYELQHIRNLFETTPYTEDVLVCSLGIRFADSDAWVETTPFTIQPQNYTRLTSILEAAHAALSDDLRKAVPLPLFSFYYGMAFGPMQFEHFDPESNPTSKLFLTVTGDKNLEVRFIILEQETCAYHELKEAH